MTKNDDPDKAEREGITRDDKGNVTVHVSTAEAVAEALAPTVEALDRIGQLLKQNMQLLEQTRDILTDTKQLQEDTKQLAADNKTLLEGTKDGIRLSWRSMLVGFIGIFVTLVIFFLSSMRS